MLKLMISQLYALEYQLVPKFYLLTVIVGIKIINLFICHKKKFHEIPSDEFSTVVCLSPT